MILSVSPLVAKGARPSRFLLLLPWLRRLLLLLLLPVLATAAVAVAVAAIAVVASTAPAVGRVVSAVTTERTGCCTVSL